MKITKKIIASLSVLMSLGFVACGSQPNHEHKFGDVTFSWNEDKCTATKACTVSGCKETKSETKTGTYVKEKDATCTVAESGHYEVTFTDVCTDTKQSDTVSKGEPLGHDFDNPIYTWGKDDKANECTASALCKREGCGEKVTETATAEYVEDTAPTCEVDGKGHFYASFETDGFEDQETAENSVIDVDSKTGHSYIGAEISYNWSDDTCTASRECVREGCNHVDSETKQGTYVTDTDATCTTDETGHYHVDFDDTTFGEADTEKDSVKKEHTAKNHEFGEASYKWESDKCTATHTCNRVGCGYVESEEATIANGKTSYSKDTDAKCEQNEKGHYIATFGTIGFAQQTTGENSVEKPGTALAHEFGNPNYSWGEGDDSNKCTATAFCTRAGCNKDVTETVTGTYVQDTAPTCTEDGKGHYKATFTIAGFEEQNTAENGVIASGSATGHNFGGTVTYTWGEGADANKCTASHGCQNPNCTEKETETVTGEYVQDTAPTCEDDGKGHYLAKFDNEDFEDQETAQNSVIDTDSKTGHSYIGAEISYNWSGDTCTASRECVREGCNHVDSETKQGTYVKDTDATCLTDEKGHYHVAFNNTDFGEANTDPNSVTKENTATGHEFGGEITYSWNGDKCIASWKCVHTGCNETQTEEATKENGKVVEVVDTEPSCCNPGTGHYKATFDSVGSGSGTSDSESFEISATGHQNIVKQDGLAPTTSSAGYKDYYKCSDCGSLFEDEAGATPIDNIATWKAEGGRGYIPICGNVTISTQSAGKDSWSYTAPSPENNLIHVGSTLGYWDNIKGDDSGDYLAIRVFQWTDWEPTSAGLTATFTNSTPVTINNLSFSYRIAHFEFQSNDLTMEISIEGGGISTVIDTINFDTKDVAKDFDIEFAKKFDNLIFEKLNIKLISNDAKGSVTGNSVVFIKDISAKYCENASVETGTVAINVEDTTEGVWNSERKSEAGNVVIPNHVGWAGNDEMDGDFVMIQTYQYTGWAPYQPGVKVTYTNSNVKKVNKLKFTLYLNSGCFVASKLTMRIYIKGDNEIRELGPVIIDKETAVFGGGGAIIERDFSSIAFESLIITTSTNEPNTVNGSTCVFIKDATASYIA